MGDVFSFPRTSREIAKLASLRPVEPVQERPRVDVTGGVDGCTVWLLGHRHRTGLTISNASRIAAALMILDALDALPGQDPPPTEAVRSMLKASVDALGDEPGPEAA